MSCEYCNRLLGHSTRCPNYVPPKCKHYCEICGEGIESNEYYIQLFNNSYAHLDCLAVKSLLDMLDIPIKNMSEDEAYV